ncbi:hypothetical protein [Dialister pneumosintes]|uniref:Uncharacterized protein n=1 Tax=Dialister pneumosintes TaxID=39950 RepID=A0A1B3WCT8_9FIRM|nr:hypothetical protein [Dialister pneumosintes]AOH38783.1 hypothetical protein BCB69_01575 [Dialister pneumosintes]
MNFKLNKLTLSLILNAICTVAVIALSIVVSNQQSEIKILQKNQIITTDISTYDSRILDCENRILDLEDNLSSSNDRIDDLIRAFNSLVSELNGWQFI